MSLNQQPTAPHGVLQWTALVLLMTGSLFWISVSGEPSSVRSASDSVPAPIVEQARAENWRVTPNLEGADDAGGIENDLDGNASALQIP